MTTSEAKEDETPTVVEEKVVTSAGEVICKRYQKGRFLGKGGFARCYEFTSLDNHKVYAGKVVVKESLKRSRAKQKMMSEIKIHRSVQHPGIVNFEHFFEDSQNVYILLEMCSNQSLSEIVRRRKRLTEFEVQCYLVQLLAPLKYLREEKVIHRDLKLGNLFLTEKMELKIGDFGLAARVEHDGERKRTICGTPNYIAPEVLDSREGHSYEVDIWAVGIIIYALLVGRPPFETPDVKATYRRIRTNYYSFPDSVPLSPQAKGLITRLLVTDPSKRPSIEEIFANDFLNQGNSIPKLMPVATLACPPSKAYFEQFQVRSLGLISPIDRLMETAPISIRTLSCSDGKFANTDRISPLTSIRHSIVPMDRQEITLAEADIWVTKWVDYSSKYGLGYQMNNGTIGVFFNDATKILLGRDESSFLYAARTQGEAQDKVVPYTLADFPKELGKKVTLLQHFRSYLDCENVHETRVEGRFAVPIEPIFVKKWTKTKHAILFRLTNKSIQVIFQDSTELLLSSDTQILTYRNKQGIRSAHMLTQALESSNQEMAKRLKYMKDILAHMLGKPDPGAAPGET